MRMRMTVIIIISMFKQTWTVDSLFKGARRIHINRVCFIYLFLFMAP
jgi:hypothetical protein